LRVDVMRPCAAWRDLPRAAARCTRAARAALDAAGVANLDLASGAVEVSIVLGDDALARRLNREWRGKDVPTNVLSFPAQDFAGSAPSLPNGAILPLGDIVLAFETIRGEAAAQGKALADHLSHLVVHGTLHLLGFDHLAEAEAERMEGLERGILAALGIADPYAPPARRAEAAHG